MIIANQKKQTNIAEYILYMWQIEEIIRLNRFDLSLINDAVISKFNVEKEVQLEIKMWYQNLIEQMMKEQIADKGHLKSVMAYVEDLNNLHTSLLTSVQDKKYQELYLNAKENINNYIIKSGGEAKNDVHACLSALYGYLILKLKSTDISKETKNAMDTFSAMIAYLAKKYHDLLKGKSKYPQEINN